MFKVGFHHSLYNLRLKMYYKYNIQQTIVYVTIGNV